MIGRKLVCAVVIVFGGCAESHDEVSTVDQAVSTCVLVDAAGDAMLSNPPASQSFGTKPILRIGGKDETLVRFALPTLPPSAVVDNATLELYVSDSDSLAPISAHRALASWNESTVTYASFNQQFDPSVIGAFVAYNASGWKSIDLTSQTKNWLVGAQPNFGVLIETASSGKTVVVSREAGTATQKPHLRICYSVPPTNFCATDPCVNGTCNNTASGYTCECQPGYTGTNCETRIDNCAATPCEHHGACTNELGGYVCTCELGYEGTNCETTTDNCAGAPCQNGGICTNGIGSYTCGCLPGYTGANCEVLIDHCAGGVCQNGATCTNNSAGYTCGCSTGFTGTNCEINIDDCANQPCHNGGTCLDAAASFTCSCSPDWGGPFCDINLNSCAQHPCLNNASCTNVSGGYTCGCQSGYTGTNCEIDINDCASHPCQNGGACTDGIAGFTCECATGFSGPTCETAASVCGDGVVDPLYETCDDGNASTCGSCNASCNVGQLTAATGMIVPVPFTELNDGGSFTLNDGVGTTITFEFDQDEPSDVQEGAKAIILDNNSMPSHAADKIAEAINEAELRITAVADGNVVILTHQVATSLGNQAIVTHLLPADFYVDGMSGGTSTACADGSCDQLARATGMIIPSPLSELSDGYFFTINDGFGTSIRFEFDADDPSDVQAGATAIFLDGNAARSHAARKIAEAINGEMLKVVAEVDGRVVLLTHQVATSLGNQAITTQVPYEFYVHGMSGGRGGDCGAGIRCVSGADCASGLCSFGYCQ